MKSLIFLYILVLCTACAPQDVARVESSPTVLATPPSLATTRPAFTSSLAPTATPDPSPTSTFDVVIDNVAIGLQGQVYASGYGTDLQQMPQQHIAQWDRAEWIALDTGFQLASNSLAVDSAGHLYVEVFTDSQQGLSNAIMRWDGGKWEDIAGNFGIVVDALKPGRVSSNIPVMALALDGEDNLYAAGSFYYPGTDHTDEFPIGYVAKWNKETWTVLGKGFDKVNIFALAVSATGTVYVSGEQPLTPEGNSSYIAQWDGEKWKQLSTNMPNTSLHLALDRSGRLYASGQLDDEPGAFVVYWDRTDWITIADQFEGDAPAVFDMTVDANGHLYIGGSFHSVSGVPAQNIAYWDGSSWHALGEGVNQQVDALAFDRGGDLYAVGLFTEAGGLPVQHVARWDGETWHALGP